jgi:nucleoid-associated protein YgaU
MKTNFAKTTVSTVVLALAAFGAASSFAANNPTDARTRADVRAETLQAVKAGTIVSHGEGAALQEPVLVSNTTRAQVQADYLQAVKNGQIEFRGEGAEAPVKTTVSSLTREQVRADARVYKDLP